MGLCRLSAQPLQFLLEDLYLLYRLVLLSVQPLPADRLGRLVLCHLVLLGDRLVLYLRVVLVGLLVRVGLVPLRRYRVLPGVRQGRGVL